MSGTTCGVIQGLHVAEQLLVRFAAQVEKYAQFVHLFGQFSISAVAGVQQGYAQNRQSATANEACRGEDEGNDCYRLHSADLPTLGHFHHSCGDQGNHEVIAVGCAGQVQPNVFQHEVVKVLQRGSMVGKDADHGREQVHDYASTGETKIILLLRWGHEASRCDAWKPDTREARMSRRCLAAYSASDLRMRQCSTNMAPVRMTPAMDMLTSKPNIDSYLSLVPRDPNWIRTSVNGFAVRRLTTRP